MRKTLTLDHLQQSNCLWDQSNCHVGCRLNCSCRRADGPCFLRQAPRKYIHEVFANGWFMRWLTASLMFCMISFWSSSSTISQLRAGPWKFRVHEGLVDGAWMGKISPSAVMAVTTLLTASKGPRYMVFASSSGKTIIWGEFKLVKSTRGTRKNSRWWSVFQRRRGDYGYSMK